MVTTEEMKKRFALTEEQKALLKEWENLSERMNKANMLFILDEYESEITVINDKDVDELCDGGSLPYEDVEDYQEIEENDCMAWNNFRLPNLTTYNSDYDDLFVKFKK